MRDIHATSLDELTELLLHSRYARVLLSVIGSSCHLKTDKYFAVGLAIIANASSNDLSAYVHHKATGWYRRFPPVGSPDRADEKDLCPCVKKGAEGQVRQAGAEAEVIEERAVKMSESIPTMIRTRCHAMKPYFRSFFMKTSSSHMVTLHVL